MYFVTYLLGYLRSSGKQNCKKWRLIGIGIPEIWVEIVAWNCGCTVIRNYEMMGIFRVFLMYYLLCNFFSLVWVDCVKICCNDNKTWVLWEESQYGGFPARLRDFGGKLALMLPPEKNLTVYITMCALIKTFISVAWNIFVSRYILTIYITVLVTRGRHFGARESVWSYFFEAKPRKNIIKTDSRASKWLPRSQKQCWIKLYLTFGSKMDQYYNMAQGSS
jgi:hypothetical protein